MILYSSFENFQRRYPGVEVLEHIRDKKGVYCLRICNRHKGTEAYFAAKSSMNGNEVSIHAELFSRLKLKNRPLFLAIGDHLFYKFFAADIERDQRTNYRNGVKMINFSIRAGRSLQAGAEEHSNHPTLQALKREFQIEFLFEGSMK